MFARMLGKRAVLFAHRGASGERPENTLPAFAKAIADGADVLELDVHLTRDGHVIILHDATLERTTDGSGYAKDRTLAELRALDAGAKFSPAFPATIPTLAELLDQNDLPLNIEIKVNDPELVSRTVSLLEDRGRLSRTILAAEDDTTMRAIRDHAPHAKTSMSANEVLMFLRDADQPSFRSPAVALQVPPSFEGFPVITERTISNAHRLGLEVHAWTIDLASEAEALVEAGVDGIMSNFPGRIRLPA